MFSRFQRFMYGRYGGDGFTLFLLVVGLIFSFIGRVFFWPAFLVADAFYIYALFRMFSKNIPARQMEYRQFRRLSESVMGWLKLQKKKYQERGAVKYFKCPKCGQQLRAPRGRGKIEVTCQRCHHVFRTKT